MANFMDLVMANLRGEPAPDTVASTPAPLPTTPPVTPIAPAASTSVPGVNPEDRTYFNTSGTPVAAGSIPYDAANSMAMNTYYDINGNAVKGGRQADGSTIGLSPNGPIMHYNAQGQAIPGGLYTSAADAAYWKQRTQSAIGGGAVIGGGITPAQQDANLRAYLGQPSSGVNGSAKPAATGQPVNQPSTQSNILQRLAQALQAQRGISAAGAKTTPTTGNSYYSQLAQMLTQRFGGNGITSAGQNGLLKNNSLYSNYLK